MKKLFVIVIAFIMLITGSSCSYNNKENKFVLINSNRNFEIYKYCYNDFSSDYFLFIFDNYGEKLDVWNCGRSEPKIKKINNSIFECSVAFGTNATEYKYYDVSKKLKSEAFQNVYYCQDNMIAFVTYTDDSTNICYKGIFDKSALLIEKLDMDGIMTTQFEVSVENNVLCITHAKGKEYNEIKECFEIKQVLEKH